MLALRKGLFDQYAQPFRLGKFQNYLLTLINPCFQPMQIYPARIKKNWHRICRFLGTHFYYGGLR